ncbi:hypothetical protein F5Y04DRAFT_259729 [Hypomontagnella monticulosa]|nr:hypothetical protein F5Y04DRAFT_259729 [Hypomontagnella monticulosa]
MVIYIASRYSRSSRGGSSYYGHSTKPSSSKPKEPRDKSEDMYLSRPLGKKNDVQIIYKPKSGARSSKHRPSGSSYSRSYSRSPPPMARSPMPRSPMPRSLPPRSPIPDTRATTPVAAYQPEFQRPYPASMLSQSPSPSPSPPLPPYNPAQYGQQQYGQQQQYGPPPEQAYPQAPTPVPQRFVPGGLAADGMQYGHAYATPPQYRHETEANLRAAMEAGHYPANTPIGPPNIQIENNIHLTESVAGDLPRRVGAGIAASSTDTPFRAEVRGVSPGMIRLVIGVALRGQARNFLWKASSPVAAIKPDPRTERLQTF